jgi:pimeloyl-ACP methyl ester carboxylesterase
MSSSKVLYTFIALSGFTHALAVPYHSGGYGITNWKAVYGPRPQPWKIDVDPQFISLTKLKASLTRVPDETLLDLPPYTTQRYETERELVIPDFEDGPPLHNLTALRDYWTNEYDWFTIQESLNNQFKHFTTTVHSPNFSDPIPLHFIHHKSRREDAVPLLFIHGWPGSFLEVAKILPGLLNPPDASLPAFHVVAPSLPGFGFSPAPRHKGLALRETGHGFNELMLQLGYNKYVIQGGDFGGFTLRHMAVDFPNNIVSVLSNFWLITPNETDLARYQAGLTDAQENFTIEALTNFSNFEGYRYIQQTRPYNLAAAMTDSPVGNAAYIYDFMARHADQYPWTLEEVITWSMMYYIQGPYSGFRMYKELATEGDWVNAFPYVTQPVGISTFPNDGFFTPLSWAEKYGNITVIYGPHNHGGHFAAHEVPELLLEDIRNFWSNDTLSDVGVFHVGK